METLDLSRRGVLLNDEQLGPYPLEKLKRVERLTVDIVEDSPRVDEKEMAFAKCRLGGFGDVLKKRMEDFTVRVPIGASYYHFQKYLNDYPENEVAPEKAPLPEDTRIVTRHIKKMAYFTGRRWWECARCPGMCITPPRWTARRWSGFTDTRWCFWYAPSCPPLRPPTGTSGWMTPLPIRHISGWPACPTPWSTISAAWAGQPAATPSTTT